jgi:hypothetical protein
MFDEAIAESLRSDSPERRRRALRLRIISIMEYWDSKATERIDAIIETFILAGWKEGKMDEDKEKPFVTVRDAVKVPETIWDSTPEEMRLPYHEEFRKNGYVYGVRGKGE